MIFTIFFPDANSAGIRREPAEGADFWMEMECAQWFLLRSLCEFYSSSPALPILLAALYRDDAFVGGCISEGKTEVGDPDVRIAEFRNAGSGRMMHSAGLRGMESEVSDEEKKIAEIKLRGLYSSILQRPVTLKPGWEGKTAKYIRAAHPECRLEYKGFGSFLGYSDIDRCVFWSPFLLLRHLQLRYRRHGEEITDILTALAKTAGLSYDRREITAETAGESARAAVDAVRRKYRPSQIRRNDIPGNN